MSWTSSGMPRMNSTYTPLIMLTILLFETAPSPANSPITIAPMIARTVTWKVVGAPLITTRKIER